MFSGDCTGGTDVIGSQHYPLLAQDKHALIATLLCLHNENAMQREKSCT